MRQEDTADKKVFFKSRHNQNPTLFISEKKKKNENKNKKPTLERETVCTIANHISLFLFIRLLSDQTTENKYRSFQALQLGNEIRQLGCPISGKLQIIMTLHQPDL